MGLFLHFVTLALALSPAGVRGTDLSVRDTCMYFVGLSNDYQADETQPRSRNLAVQSHTV